MALDAGSVFTILGGKFEAGGFREFDAANRKAAASAEAAEGRMVASAGRVGKAHERLASSTDRVVQSAARMREAVPLAAMDKWSSQSSQAEKNLSKLGW